MAGLSDWYEANLSQVSPRDLYPSLEWLHVLQKQQMQAFIEQGLPTRKIEAWHYTDVSAIKNHILKIKKSSEPAIQIQTLKKMVEEVRLEIDSHLLVFVNGYFDSALSYIQNLPQGVVLSNIADILKNQPELIKPYLIEFSQQSINQPFACFNTAMLSDGLFLWMPDDTAIKHPIHILCLNNFDRPEENMANFRHIIITGKNTNVSLFEDYRAMRNTSAHSSFYFNNIVTQIYLDKNAVINHYKLQNEGAGAYHIGYIAVKQEKGSCMHRHDFSLGAYLARDDLQVNLNAPETHCQLSGLYLPKNQQHIDQHIVVNHHSGYSSSEQLYRGVVRGDATAVFNGRVVVHPGAQKSNAKQSNQNLLLSKTAVVNTKPEFEIYADDVQCTHGATVGHMDESALFYLRSRGLDTQKATSLLVDAFTGIVLKRITLPAIGKKITEAVKEKSNEY